LKAELDHILAENGADALLLYSDSKKDANMYYVSNFLAPDPFIYLKRVDSPAVIVVSQMEYLRAQKQAAVKDVKSVQDYDYLKVVQSAKDPQLGSIKFIANVAKQELGKDAKICVPPTFPVMVADVLRGEGLTVVPMFDVVEKARETKDPKEVQAIKQIQKVNEQVTGEVIDLIAGCDVGANKVLLCNGEPLTVGMVKAVFGTKFIQNGCLPEEDIIVSCGPKSSDPHYVGEPGDKLKADQPIILDVYPWSIQKCYWTDMTRTVVKGKASAKVWKMFEAVQEAKNVSMDGIHAGANASQVYGLCCDVLERNGFETTRGGRRVTVGMTHTLGHGVGLQIHESPRLGEFSDFGLREHCVVTVEPGVYDPKTGGMRLEDIIEVTKGGYNNLTQMQTILEI
jgi:Xaa-Pro aminopeptidase